MKRSKFTEDQIAFALKQAELGTSVDEVCRKMGIAEATFYIYGLLPFCKRVFSVADMATADIYSASAAKICGAPGGESRTHAPQQVDGPEGRHKNQVPRTSVRPVMPSVESPSQSWTV